MKKLNDNTKYSILIIAIMMLSACLLIYLTDLKEGMHVDEYLTYGLANNHEDSGTYKFSPKFGEKLSATEVFDNYFYADAVNIRNVWINQGNNVHPPLYYLLFHVFLLCTNHFLALKTGILLNILLHVINIGLIWLVLNEVLSTKWGSFLGTLLYAFMPIVLGSVLFIRMYVLLSTVILLLTLLFVKEWDGTNKKVFYIKLGVLSVCGALTHYYFLIYLFFCCLIWGIRILCKRNWKELGVFLGTMTAAGALSLAIFPYILSHVFSGNAGKRTASTLMSVSDSIRNLKAFWKAIDNVYGGFLLVVVAVALGFILYRNVIYDRGARTEDRVKRWMIIVIPCFLYLVIVTKIAIYAATRYISPMYGICIIVLMMLVDHMLSYTKVNCNAKTVTILLMVGMLLNNSWKSYNWPELYLEAEKCVDTAKEYGVNNECICVHGTSWRMLTSYQEFIQYQNIMFIQPDAVEQLYEDKSRGYDHVVMYFDKELGGENIEEVIKKMIEVNDGLNTYKKLHEYSYSVSYYLE